MAESARHGPESLFRSIVAAALLTPRDYENQRNIASEIAIHPEEALFESTAGDGSRQSRGGRCRDLPTADGDRDLIAPHERALRGELLQQGSAGHFRTLRGIVWILGPVNVRFGGAHGDKSVALGAHHLRGSLGRRVPAAMVTDLVEIQICKDLLGGGAHGA